MNLQPHGARENLGDASAVVVDVEVEQTVVVVIPEPACEAQVGPGDAKIRCDVFELAIAQVAIQAAGLAHVRHEEIDPAVAVVVAPGRSLGASQIGNSRCLRHVLERTVALVVIQPAAIAGIALFLRRRATGRQVFTADEHVDEPVVVVIAPGSRFRRDRLGQPAGNGHVGESAAVIAQQRHAQRCLPGAAQKQNVEIAVVVEIGARHVECIDLVRRVPPRQIGLRNVPSPRLMSRVAPSSASSDVVNRSGRLSPLKSSKMLPPARLGPRTPSPAESATL